MNTLDIKKLLPELKKQVTLLADDLLKRVTGDAKINAGLQDAFKQIEQGGRTAQAYEVWLDDYLDQVAVAWVLSCVFVRFMEDNGLIDECWLAGEGPRRKLAEDTHELFFREHPRDTDREYFQHVFREVGKIPAAADLFAEGKTPLWAVGPSGDAAMKLLSFWREQVEDMDNPPLKRSFEVDSGDTRFLGDLYQELSEKAKKKYALLQTPVFVEEFILDRTLTPAINEFGFGEVRMIDPTCGSGHFLLGGFSRLFMLWSRPEYTSGNTEKDAQNALDGVWGVDINPFAVAIARFRLIVAAVQACGIKQLKRAPGWKIHLATGDSLLFGSRWNTDGTKREEVRYLDDSWAPEIYACEDNAAVKDVLGQQYHAVVGNPPYIVVRDAKLNEAYRERFPKVCYRQYSLGVPFTERFFDLCVSGDKGKSGFLGMITTNSFMKREFGKKLIEEFFPKIDLTHVIDTSGAYIPGHGTPTVILLGRNRKPVGDSIRAVLGIKGEPSPPHDASQGFVWQSVINQIDRAGSQDNYISTADVLRSTFSVHPWSVGGGGAGELMDAIEGASKTTLAFSIESIGRTSVVGEDDCWIMERDIPSRHGFSDYCVSFALGDCIREWQAIGLPSVIYPYKSLGGVPIDPLPNVLCRWLWPFRTLLSGRSVFGKSMADNGRRWYEHLEHYTSKLRSPLSIPFAFVATHNHFVLDEGGNIFNRSAPIIKLSVDANKDDHLSLVGLLNSSTACFWMKQVMSCKGLGGQGGGIKPEHWSRQYEFAATQMERCPVPENYRSLIPFARELDRLGKAGSAFLPDEIVRAESGDLENRLTSARKSFESIRRKMVAIQEELDWKTYALFGLCRDTAIPVESVCELHPEDRPVERLLKEQLENGATSIFYDVHSYRGTGERTSSPDGKTESIIQERLAIINNVSEVRMLEQLDFKRRWQAEPWERQQAQALRLWLLSRLESQAYWPSRNGSNPFLQSTATLADKVSVDHEFLHVAALFQGRPDFDVAALVAELVVGEAVPFMPILRYKPSGLRQRQVWERTWDFQRQQDRGLELGKIPVPPKYSSVDYVKSDYWRLRGKLDVPKERWISYPHCSTDSDPSLVVGWAGWNHLEQATALVAYYDARKREGWPTNRLKPLLAGLDQLIPWVHQWHPEVDPEYGETAGQSFQHMLESDAHELGLTLEDIRNWTPPEKPVKVSKKKASTKKSKGEQAE